MFENLFLVVYGLTVFMFLIGFTVGTINGKWNKKIHEAAETVVEKIEQRSGHRFNEKAMASFIEFTTVVMFLLPVINTYVFVNGMVKKYRVRKAINTGVNKIVDEHTKFLDD